MRIHQYILMMILLVLMAMRASTVYIVKPSYFPQPSYNFNDNTLSEGKISLGRMLFYDPILSRDSSISCATCHSPFNAFAHADHALSHGIDDRIGTRNAPALFNLAWKKSFMWDGAIHHLDMQALAPISHTSEMDYDITSVVSRLQQSKLYAPLFQRNFDSPVITGEHVLKAIAQFQLTLVSADSKYDKVKTGEATFTEQEASGYRLFLSHCNRCHQEPLFTNDKFDSNLIPVDQSLKDEGRAKISQDKKDLYKFKVPSLRNLDYSFPYMHDGRFRHLSEVLDHYQKADFENKIVLSNSEEKDLLSFLITLNDSSFIFNKNHHYPHQLYSTNQRYE